MMRNVVLVLASSVALVFAACDRDANNNRGPEPTWHGGGPPAVEHPMSTTYGTYDQGVQPAPSGSAGHEFPGMGKAPESSDAYNEANGGTGAGVTGTKGEGETLHDGLNPKADESRPKMGQKKFDLGPGDRTPKQ